MPSSYSSARDSDASSMLSTSGRASTASTAATDVDVDTASGASNTAATTTDRRRARRPFSFVPATTTSVAGSTNPRTLTDRETRRANRLQAKKAEHMAYIDDTMRKYGLESEFLSTFGSGVSGADSELATLVEVASSRPTQWDRWHTSVSTKAQTDDKSYKALAKAMGLLEAHGVISRDISKATTGGNKRSRRRARRQQKDSEKAQRSAMESAGSSATGDSTSGTVRDAGSTRL